MKRHIYRRLTEWKASTTRKPLMLYGARQVEASSFIEGKVKNSGIFLA